MIVSPLTVVSVKMTSEELERLDEIAEEHYMHNRSRAIIAGLAALREKHKVPAKVEKKITATRNAHRRRRGAHASR